MNFIFEKIIKFRKFIIAIFLILVLVSTFAFTKVGINYNMQDYLPKNANSTKAIEVMTKNFDDTIANANVMIPNITITEAIEYKNKLLEIDGVESVTWLDQGVDISAMQALMNPDGTLNLSPLDDQTRNTIESYYKDKNALFGVTITSGKEQSTVNAIYDLIGEDAAMNGSAVEQAISQNLAVEQSMKAIMLIAPLVILILILSTTSWIEPFIYLTTIGIAVLINLGICIFRGEISYVTLAVAPLLQLAVSLDYAVFLSHSFDKYRRKKMDIKDAMKYAMKDSLKSISASCLTTLFGFIALLFMNFLIGPDMGISLVIGVLLSFVAVLTLLPALILCTYKLNDKCKHKPFLPSFKGLSKLLIKLRIPLLIIVAFLMLFSYSRQNDTSYIYGSGEPSKESRIAIDNKKIEDTFGNNNMIAILVPKGNQKNEVKLVNELNELGYVDNIISYVSAVGTEVPENMVPENIKSKFYSDKYARIILTTTLDSEGEKAFESVEEVKKIVNKYYSEDDTYMCGNTVNMYDMKTTIEDDNKLVSLITIVAIFIVLLIEFKSLIIPIILIFAVKGSIWITMALSGISGDPLSYLGYLVVSTVMMGATIDYAILITDNYLKNREKLTKINAMKETLSTSIKSILVSASTLAFAGFALGLTSSENIVKSLGLMLGEGTVIAFVISITLLPAVLLLLDKLIPKLSYKLHFTSEDIKDDDIMEVKHRTNLSDRRVICINREYGSGGHEIGKRLAEQLNIKFLDDEILEKSAEKIGISIDKIEKADEKLKRRLLYSVLYEGTEEEFYGMNASDILFEVQKRIILNEVKEHDCVIVGRCGADIVRNNTDAKCLTVFISANTEDRIKRKVKLENLDRKTVISKIKQTDNERSRYYKYHTHNEWKEPSSYDCTFNTSTIGLNRTVDILTLAYKRMEDE